MFCKEFSRKQEVKIYICEIEFQLKFKTNN